ncbi:MAG: hypothetical protein II072_07520 [Clostridia bacterium]|nr:hypothetical protein [Clostridia bacterium]
MADKPQKKRRGRRSFLNDFKADDSGQYSYMGNVHVYEGSVPYKTERQRVIVLTAMMCASAVAIGCIPAPSMLGYNNFYVVPFFIIELVAVFITAWAAIRLAAGGSELREYVYEKTVKAIPNRAPVAFYSALACVLANIVYLCLNGFAEKPVASAAALLLHGVIAAAAFQLRRGVEHEKWSVVLKTAGEAKTEAQAEDDGVFPSVGEEPVEKAGETAPQDPGEQSPAN